MTRPLDLLNQFAGLRDRGKGIRNLSKKGFNSCQRKFGAANSSLDCQRTIQSPPIEIEPIGVLKYFGFDEALLIGQGENCLNNLGGIPGKDDTTQVKNEVHKVVLG